MNDYRWWGIFLGTLGTGILFTMWGNTETVQGVGLMCIGSALGVGVTAKIGPTKG